MVDGRLRKKHAIVFQAGKAYSIVNEMQELTDMGKKYSIKNTTKVQREKIANEALGISTLDAAEPSEETMALMDEYIDGKMELEEVLEKTIQRYTQTG